MFGGPLSTNANPGSLFGGPPKPVSGSSTPAPTLGAGGIFGLPPKPVGSTTASTSTSATAPVLGGGLFGAKKPEASGTPTPTPPTTGGLSFGGAGGTTGGGLFGTTNKDAAKPEEKKDTATVTTNIFGPPKDSEKKTGTTAGTLTTTNGSTLGGLFGKPAEKKDTSAGEQTICFYPLPTANSLAAGTVSSTEDKCKPSGTPSALTITAQPPSMLRGKTIEEIVNKWSSDLEVQVKEFSKFATEVAVWDRALIENGNNVCSRFAGPLHITYISVDLIVGGTDG